MKISKRTLIMVVSLMLALTVTALGTVAYMTARDTVTNKFTVGNINIIVDETDVDGNQKGDPGAVTPPDPAAGLLGRDQENEYKLIPGLTQTKDPTVTVLKDSEECYVRMIVEMNCYDVLSTKTGKTGEELLTLLVGNINSDWTLHGTPVIDATGKITYEYRYNNVTTGEKVDASTEKKELQPLFNTITIPITFNQNDLAQLGGFYLEVTGEAVQTAAFDGDVDEAWKAYDKQVLNITSDDDDANSDSALTLDASTSGEGEPTTGEDEDGKLGDPTTPTEDGDTTPDNNEGGENPTLQNSVNDVVDA